MKLRKLILIQNDYYNFEFYNKPRLQCQIVSATRNAFYDPYWQNYKTGEWYINHELMNKLKRK